MSQFPPNPSEWPTPAEAYLQPKRVSVRLKDAETAPKTASNTVASPPPEGYYVILGCGLAAVLNHTLLRQTKKGKQRLTHPTNPSATLPVMHIGFEDPWKTYHPHGMGQPPYLLNMPGFHNRPPEDAHTRAIRSGMRSTEFAGITQQEWDLLKKERPFEHLTAWVPIIQYRMPDQTGSAVDQKILDALEEEGLSAAQVNHQLTRKYPDSHPPLRLLVVPPNQKMFLIYAHKIDICTGAGRPLVPDLEGCWGGRTNLWTPPAAWDDATRDRRVVNGPEALCSHTKWQPSDRVCVFGAGGIGLNMVERAEDMKCWIDWLPNPMPGAQGRYPPATTLHRTFNLERNDTVLRHAKGSGAKAGSKMEPGEAKVRSGPGNPNKLDFKLVPGEAKWRFSAHVALKDVAAVGGGIKVVIDWFKPEPEAPAFMLDHDENSTALKDGCFDFSPWYAEAHKDLAKRCYDKRVYDRLFVCAGLNNNQALGTPDTVASAFTFQRLNVNGRTVGVESDDGGRVRILGAAGVMFPRAGFAMNAHAETNKYFTSLPVSAVQPGFIYAGITIAAANGWFDEVPNTNINTMEQNELIAALKSDMGETDAATLGQQLVVERRGRNGFKDLDDAANFIRSKPDLNTLPGWLTAISKLATAYPFPLAWWT